MKKNKILGFILISALMLSGCQITDKKDGQSKSTTGVNSENIQLTVVEPKTINPILNTDKSVGYVMNLVYDSLFTTDENYDVVPQLVSKYEFSSDNKSINLVLDENAKWHDGSSVTSSDVKYTVDLIKRKSESPYHDLIDNISNVSVIDDKTCVISFKESDAFSLEKLIFPIVSKNSLSSVSDISKNENNLMGNGQYKITSYKDRVGFSLTKNETYYKDNLKSAKNIDVTIVPNEQSQVSMLTALKSDIANVSLKDLSTFQNEKQFNVTNYEGRDFESVIFNYKNEFLNNLNFRKAIAYAINRDEILEEGFAENATLTNFPLNTKSKYYSKDVKAYKYNLEKAKSYLEKAKPQKSNSNTQGIEIKDSLDIKDDKDQEENKNNQTSNNKEHEKSQKNESITAEDIKKKISKLNLKIIVNKNNSERLKTAYLISDSLKSIGIKSTIEELEDKDMEKALVDGKYDMALVGWSLSVVPDPVNIINSSGYSSTQLTTYIEELEKATTEKRKTDIFNTIQKNVVDNVAFLSLVIRHDYIVNNNRFSGILNPNDFDVYEGITNLKSK